MGNSNLVGAAGEPFLVGEEIKPEERCKLEKMMQGLGQAVWQAAAQSGCQEIKTQAEVASHRAW